MSTTILGEKIDFPICVSPTAMQKMAHPDGEVATAKGCVILIFLNNPRINVTLDSSFTNSFLAAASIGTCMTLSSWSTSTIEDVAAASTGLKWLQLYVYKDQNITLDLVRRAERAGFKAIAVTVDTPYLGRRNADVRNKFALPPHLTLANYNSTYATGVKSDKDSGLATFVSSLINSSLTWNIIPWLRSFTKLPIVVKGILTEEDARLAVQHGVDGIIVSNHGARQLDTVPSTVNIVLGYCHSYILSKLVVLCILD
jgi:(S)-2-hydroxy-acid oxidase